MRHYIKSPENVLVNHIKTGKEVSDQIFPISVQLKPKWLASFLHKQKGSDIIPHLAYFNFQSNRDYMVTGYANSQKLIDNYGPLLYTEGMLTPYVGKLHEFESLDYRKVGGRVRDWVSMVYQNRSKTETVPFPFGASLEFLSDLVYPLQKKYPTYYAYAFDDAGTISNYNTQYFINSRPKLFQFDLTQPQISKVRNEQCILTDGVATVTPYDWIDSTTSGPKVQGNYNNSVLNSLVLPSTRTMSIKVDEASTRYNVTTKEEYTYVNAKDNAEPLIYFSQLYNSEWNRWECIDLVNTFGESGDFLSFKEGFFPELNERGLKYPKAGRFTRNEASPTLTFQDGTLFKSTLRHQNERDDQSTIRYEIASPMIEGDNDFFDWHVIRYWANEYLEPVIIQGIDIKGEANKRVSTTCLTEPYQVSEAMNAGEFCEYQWVDWEGNEQASLTGGLYARFRTSLPLYEELKRMYEFPEYNDDVIHTIFFRNIPFSDLPSSASDPYADFQGAYTGLSGYNLRRDFGVDDLVGGPVGIGQYYSFYITTADTLYSDGKMKVLGISEVQYHAPLPGGGYESLSGMVIYVGNYTPENAPPHNDPNPPAVTEVEFIDLSGFIENDDYVITRYESLKPMLKIHDMQGNIKMKSITNRIVPVKKTNTYVEFHAEMETPFCVGMNDTRLNASSFDDNDKPLWNRTQILRRKSYIPAGSQEVIDGKKEMYNRRKLPLGNALMTPYLIAANRPHPTERLLDKLTGKVFDYPPYSVWWNVDRSWPNLSRPIEEEYSDHGTYNFRIEGYGGGGSGDFPVHPTFDVRLLVYANNQKWRFGEKYLSYVERENPSFIYKMSIKTFLEDYTKYQTHNYGIPDNKQYVASLAKGNIEANQGSLEQPIQEVVEDVYGSEFRDILGDMKTDMKLEFWDFNLKKWQPFNQTSFSSSKKVRTEKVGNLFIVDSTMFLSNNPEDLITTPKPFWKVTLGYLDPDTQVIEMPSEAFDLDGEVNFALYNSDQEKAYHVANIKAIVYDEFGAGPDNNALEIIVEDDAVGDLIVGGESAIDPSNIPANYVAPLSLNTPEQLKSGVSDFQFNSQVSKPNEFKTVALSTELNPDAFDTDNETFYLRFSAEVSAEYRMGDKEIQYVGEGLDTGATVLEKEYSNFPWGDGTTFDTVFDFSKINVKEVVTRINQHYINLNNVY